MTRRFLSGTFILLATILLGCTATAGNESTTPQATGVPPTVHPQLSTTNTETGPDAAPAGAAATATPTASPSPSPPAEEAAGTDTENRVFRTVTIFDETLSADWTLEYSGPGTPRVTSDYAYQGENAVAFTPRRAFSELIFALREDAELELRRDEVYSVQFWFNSGEGVVETDDLGIIITGSDLLSYYDPGDDSVIPLVEECDPFCFTRLYFLGFNRTIPEDTWSPVQLEMDTLVFDPYTEYITGIVISSGEDSFQTIYLDKVELTIVESEQ